MVISLNFQCNLPDTSKIFRITYVNRYRRYLSITGTGFFLPDNGVSCEETNRLHVNDLRTCQSAAARFRSIQNEPSEWEGIGFNYNKHSDTLEHSEHSYCEFNKETFDYTRYRKWNFNLLGYRQQLCLSGSHDNNIVRSSIKLFLTSR